MNYRLLSTRDDLILRVAFRIEDPCGLVEVQLAQAVIELVESVDESQRVQLTNDLRVLAHKYRKEPKYDDRTGS